MDYAVKTRLLHLALYLQKICHIAASAHAETFFVNWKLKCPFNKIKWASTAIEKSYSNTHLSFHETVPFN